MDYILLRDCIEHKAGTIFRPTKEGRYIADRNADGFELGYAAHWVELNSELFKPLIPNRLYTKEEMKECWRYAKHVRHGLDFETFLIYL